jgi:outer membrane protein OmpA-like peptidoglycan-associated protein
MVNGSPAPGGTGASFTVPTTTSGTQTVTVRVSVSNPDASATSNPVSVVVKPLTPPTVRFAISPATIPYGNTVALNATATGSECGGAATVRYSGEGVTGSTFDSKALSFDMSNRLREQSRTVRITATATDAKGQTATAPADVTVTLKSEARRLDDIVFPQMSARVNNCAKRVLLEQLTPMLRNDPQAKVILVGHRDESERGRAGLKMDESRVVNAAAVLSAGTGICPQLDLSRIMWKAAGTDQSAETRPALCGSSTDVKERGGSAIRTADKRAQYRRVEIWIVPGGADMPAGVTGLQAVPEKDVKAKGCPK